MKYLRDFNSFILNEARAAFMDIINDSSIISKIVKFLGLSEYPITIGERSSRSVRYKIGREKCVILTTEISEAESAHKLSKKPITKHILNTYNVQQLMNEFLEKQKNKKLFYILTDYYQLPNAEDIKFIDLIMSNSDTQTMDEEDSLDLFIVDHVMDKYPDTELERIVYLYNQIVEIIKEAKKLKFSYLDIRSNKLGWSADSNLMLIDVGFQNFYNLGSTKPITIFKL
jgi:hypothetical protein